MAVLRAPELVLLQDVGVPKELLDWSSSCWHRSAGDWAMEFISAANAWAVEHGIVLEGGQADWRPLRSEFGIIRPRRLSRWPV